MHIIRKKLLILLLMISVVHADWNTNINVATKNLSEYTLINKDPLTGLVVDQIIIDTFIAAWGFKYWSWGEKSLHFKQEPWFEKNSETGGSDKTGHFYMTYLLSRIMASRMEDRGWSLEKASLGGALSGILAMTLLEVGDGTSNYGFSREDLLADALGAGLGYVLRSNPRADDFIDVRLEYIPTANYLKGGDNTTDYSGMKHLIAVKAAGFESLKHTYWSLLELQIGYYARGYRTIDTVEQSQHLYAGIGISLANLAERSEINILKNMFEFYQPGHTYKAVDIWSR